MESPGMGVGDKRKERKTVFHKFWTLRKNVQWQGERIGARRSVDMSHRSTVNLRIKRSAQRRYQSRIGIPSEFCSEAVESVFVTGGCEAAIVVKLICGGGGFKSVWV